VASFGGKSVGKFERWKIAKFGQERMSASQGQLDANKGSNVGVKRKTIVVMGWEAGRRS
jgi:hypothetical protein